MLIKQLKKILFVFASVELGMVIGFSISDITLSSGMMKMVLVASAMVTAGYLLFEWLGEVFRRKRG